MENGMHYQAHLLPLCSSRSPSDPPNMDMEAPGPVLTQSPQGDTGGTTELGGMDTIVRVPPRVDSCPDMDTRPPLTPELIGMDLDAQTEGAAAEGTFHMQDLLCQLPTLDYQPEQIDLTSSTPDSCELAYKSVEETYEVQGEGHPCPLHIATGKGLGRTLRLESDSSTVPSNSRGLFLADAGTDELLSLLQYEGSSVAEGDTPLARMEAVIRNEEPSPSSNREEGNPEWGQGEAPSSSSEMSRDNSSCSLSEVPEAAWAEPEGEQHPPQENEEEGLEIRPNYPTLPKVPGPCDPDDLLDGVIFGAKYLGSTQLHCEKYTGVNARMRQAQEAVDRVKAPEGESQPMTEVDVMVSTRRVKVLTADTQEALMDHPLQTISYTADIGNIVVLMARRKSPRSKDQPPTQKRSYRMLCHVFESADAQLIAQAIGQAFGLAYQFFMHTEGVEHTESRSERGEEQLYNADLAHFSNRDNCREVYISKQRGEMLGVAVVESGWGSLLPTVVIANLMHGGPAERSGELSIGDHVTSVNGTSLVGLPLSTCQGIIRDLKSLSEVNLNIVRCPPVITAIIQRPDVTHQLGFCVEDGVICSLVRGGIAERGGIRVGHRIIEINGQSVVATAHEKIIQTLLDATGEVHIKTMPASTYRLLTGQETPVYL
ncbi:amyloid-beta A4 precursor protein-binding family A member 3 [Discoglossus pictus]